MFTETTDIMGDEIAATGVIAVTIVKSAAVANTEEENTEVETDDAVEVEAVTAEVTATVTATTITMKNTFLHPSSLSRWEEFRTARRPMKLPTGSSRKPTV